MTNLIDRTLANIAPAMALRRHIARAQLASLSASASAPGAGGSVGGNGAGSRSWWPFARDAAADTLRHLPLQRAASRELARSNPIACGAINTVVDRVVGTGLAFVASPNRAVLGWSADQVAEWKAGIQADFSLWSDDAQACDIAGAQTFYEAQATVLRGVKESGDIFTLLPTAERTAMRPYGLRFQLIEADRVGNPSGAFDTADMAGGIRFAQSGKPQAAHIYNHHPGAAYTMGNRLAGTWVDFTGASGRRRLLHHYIKLRPGQPRGVPYLAPVVDLIKQIGRFTDAEVNAAVLNSYFTAFVRTTAPAGPPLWDGENAPSSGEKSPAIAIGHGTVLALAKDESIDFADPKRPNQNAEPFIHAMAGLIGMALGIPRELLLKQFNSSYSASKAALLDGWIRFRNERFWLGNAFCQPIFETWMAEAVFLGRVQAPGFFSDPLLRWAYTRAAWPGDSMGSINPKDEVAAYTAAIDARLMTRERAEWELGGTDWNATFDQKVAEQERLLRSGILPAPKAGAAAPQNTRPEDTTP